jgi:diacylglycerol kinase (ATP)
MSGNKGGPVQRLVNATCYSSRGLRQAWQTEQALRYEVCVLIVAVPAAWLLGRNALERALMIVSCLQIVIVELVNSALETVVDRIGRERHELSGRAKDLGSAAVFLSIVLAGVVWLILLGDRFIN